MQNKIITFLIFLLTIAISFSQEVPTFKETPKEVEPTDENSILNNPDQPAEFKGGEVK